MSQHERERERKRENKRLAKRRRREVMMASERLQPPPPHVHAGKHGRNQYGPDYPGQLLIADCGWDNLVRIYDTSTRETRLPCSGAFRVGGWGRGGTGGQLMQFFLRKGFFPWVKLPVELKMAIVVTAMRLDRQTTHKLFAVSKEVRELATWEHIKVNGLTEARESY